MDNYDKLRLLRIRQVLATKPEVTKTPIADRLAARRAVETYGIPMLVIR